MILYEPIIQAIALHENYQADVLRLDLIHPEISGNKWFKLKYNLEEAIRNFDTVITCGGAFSNHIATTAAACKIYNLKSVAVIRGEEPAELNPTLTKAKQDGMQLHFVSRELYAQKEEDHFRDYLNAQFGKHYFIPEGGNNVAGLLGCKEILSKKWKYDYILCACGTATTFSGLVASSLTQQTVIGISVLKGENKLPQDAKHLLERSDPQSTTHIFGNDLLENLKPGNHGIINSYCFSGYAKFDKELVEFKNIFETNFQIPLDYVYTNKLFYAANDLMEKGRFNKNSKLLIIHSGGVQGNKGFEERYHLMPSRYVKL